MRCSVICFAGAVAVALGCRPAADAGSTGSAAGGTAVMDTAAMGRELDSVRIGYQAGLLAADAKGLAARFLPESQIDIQHAPRAMGLAAIEQSLTADFAMRKYQVAEITPMSRSFRTATEAFELGTYHYALDVKGKPAHEWGRYMVSAVKTPQGWLLAYVMAFADSTK